MSQLRVDLSADETVRDTEDGLGAEACGQAFPFLLELFLGCQRALGFAATAGGGYLRCDALKRFARRSMKLTAKSIIAG